MHHRAAALTIAGLDPSGGAGIAADLRGFAAAGVWGCAVCAARTVQSTRGVRSVHAVEARLVVAQARELLDDVAVRAIKIGALGSAENARAVAALLQRHRRIPVVLDPVMVPSRRTGRARLDGDAAVPTLLVLARAATLVTPNSDEAGSLLGRKIVTATDARDAAVALVELGIRAVLLKGGHTGGERVVDWFATRRSVIPLSRARLSLPPVHGAGCTLASLIAGRLAARGGRGVANEADLLAAVRWARSRHARALRNPLAIGRGMRVLDPRRRP